MLSFTETVLKRFKKMEVEKTFFIPYSQEDLDFVYLKTGLELESLIWNEDERQYSYQEWLEILIKLKAEFHNLELQFNVL